MSERRARSLAHIALRRRSGNLGDVLRCVSVLITALNALHLNITNTEKLELRAGSFSSRRWSGDLVFVYWRWNIKAITGVIFLWVAAANVSLYGAGLRSRIHGSWNAIARLSLCFTPRRTGREAWAASAVRRLRICNGIRVVRHHVDIFFIGREDLWATRLGEHGRLVIAVVLVLLRVIGPRWAAVEILRLP